MRTVTYDYVLQRACELTGRVFSTLTTEESNFFRTFISMSLRSAWECFDWPEQTVYQQEFFAQTYTYTATYNAGDVVYYPVEEKYYQWVNLTPLAGQTPTINGPKGSLNSTYWAEALPDYGNTDGNWDFSTAYSIGDTVLYPVTQEHYQAYAIPPAGTVPTDTAYWGVLNKFLRNISQTNNPDGTTRAIPIGETFSVWPGDPPRVLAPAGSPLHLHRQRHPCHSRAALRLARVPQDTAALVQRCRGHRLRFPVPLLRDLLPQGRGPDAAGRWQDRLGQPVLGVRRG